MQHGCDHAIAAAQARYGVVLDNDDFAAMVADIVLSIDNTRPPALMLARQSNERELWLVRIPDGPAVRVIYAPMLAMIITILPRHARCIRS